jgi:hypothetical protein
MATGDQHRPGWTVMLPRQPARIAKGHPEGGYTAPYEIVRCDCGDHPDLDYREVSPRASADPRPCPIAAGVAACAKYLGLDPRSEAARRPG